MVEDRQAQSDKPIFIFHAVKSTEIPYFSVSRDFAQDTGLSYEAAGLLLYLQSKPTTWRVRPSTLQRVKCGKNRVYVLLKELIEHGYVRREIFRGKKGRVDHVAYYVYPMSQLPTNQEPDKQEPENHHPENRDIRNKRGGSNKREKKSPAIAGMDTAVAIAPDTDKLTGAEWNELLEAIADVFKAHGSEALNYANMLTGRSTKGVWGKHKITPPMRCSELKAWRVWYQREYPTRELVKQPQLVFSSITEYRKPKPSTNGNHAPVTDAEKERLRPGVMDGVWRKRSEQP